jgi:hypothetical protein
MAPPQISVVIPTHNRSDSLNRLLKALSVQTLGAGNVEIVVVADGCRDDTVARVRGGQWPFRLTVLEQPASGAAAARNRGARAATAEILLFLDDDVEPEPQLLSAHVAAHSGAENVVGIGSLQPVISADGFLGMTLRGWWDEMYEPIRERGHRYCCFDVMSGHLSIRRASFDALGGFDSALRCREDYEFGYRANAAGLTFRVVDEAGAKHHETSDLAKVIGRKFAEGVADVALCKRHASLARALPLAHQPVGSRLTRPLYWLAWHQPVIGDAIAWCVARTLPVYEWFRLRFRWRARVEDLLAYWYWRGVATAATRRDQMAALISSVPRSRDGSLTLDLACGFQAAEARLDELRPSSLRLVFGPHFIGELDEAPGAEPLRGIHLRRLVAHHFANEYLRAACLAGALPEVLVNPALQRQLSSSNPLGTRR